MARKIPTQTIAAAREWARGLNEKVEAGIDPREALREEKARASMTVHIGLSPVQHIQTCWAVARNGNVHAMKRV